MSGPEKSDTTGLPEDGGGRRSRTDYTRVAIYLGVILFVALVFQRCTLMVTQAPASGVRAMREEVAATAGAVSDWIKEVFNVTPQIYINQVMISGQSAPIAELAVIERDFPVKLEWRHRQLGSTKTITLRATYKAKAGFDLMRPFRVMMDPENGSVSAEMPAAEILSLQRVGDLESDAASGWINRLSEEDRINALNTFERMAAELAQRSGILEEAEQQAAARLQELADRNRGEVSFHFRASE